MNATSPGYPSFKQRLHHRHIHQELDLIIMDLDCPYEDLSRFWILVRMLFNAIQVVVVVNPIILAAVNARA